MRSLLLWGAAGLGVLWLLKQPKGGAVASNAWVQADGPDQHVTVAANNRPVSLTHAGTLDYGSGLTGEAALYFEASKNTVQAPTEPVAGIFDSAMADVQNLLHISKAYTSATPTLSSKLGSGHAV